MLIERKSLHGIHTFSDACWEFNCLKNKTTHKKVSHVTPRHVFNQTLLLSVWILWNAPVSGPERVQGHALAGDVEAERKETSVPGILIQHYLVFSLSQSLPPPSNQNSLKVFPFGKAACIVDVCQWLTSDTQSAQKHIFFTWGLGVERFLLSSVWSGTLWMSSGLHAGVRWYEASSTPSPAAGTEERPAPLRCIHMTLWGTTPILFMSWAFKPKTHFSSDENVNIF